MSHINPQFPDSVSLSSSKVSIRSKSIRGISLISSHAQKTSIMDKLLDERQIKQYPFNLAIGRSDPTHQGEAKLIKESNIFNSHRISHQEKEKAFNKFDDSFVSQSTIGKKQETHQISRFCNYRLPEINNYQPLNQSLHPNQNRNQRPKSQFDDSAHQRQQFDLFYTITKSLSIINEIIQQPFKRINLEHVSNPSISSHSPTKVLKPNEIQQPSRNKIKKNPDYKKPKDGKYVCSCKLGMCLTNYCGCVKNGLKCSDSCECFTCHNYVGAPPKFLGGESRITEGFSKRDFDNRIKITSGNDKKQPICSFAQILMPCLILTNNLSAKTTQDVSLKESSYASENGSFELQFQLPDQKIFGNGDNLCNRQANTYQMDEYANTYKMDEQ